MTGAGFLETRHPNIRPMIRIITSPIAGTFCDPDPDVRDGVRDKARKRYSPLYADLTHPNRFTRPTRLNVRRQQMVAARPVIILSEEEQSHRPLPAPSKSSRCRPSLPEHHLQQEE